MYESLNANQACDVNQGLGLKQAQNVAWSNHLMGSQLNPCHCTSLFRYSTNKIYKLAILLEDILFCLLSFLFSITKLVFITFYDGNSYQIKINFVYWHFHWFVSLLRPAQHGRHIEKTYIIIVLPRKLVVCVILILLLIKSTTLI